MSIELILDCIFSIFRAGELSVIIGPSGSGRSTLLNILSGLVQNNVVGTLSIEGPNPPNHKLIDNQSSYIIQDQMLHPLLTVVAEAMNFAIKFKTGTTTSLPHQKCKCDAILK